MSTANIIIGVAIALFCIALIVAWRRNYRNFFAISLALGVAVIGVGVTAYRVEQYHEQQAAQEEAAQNAGIQTQPEIGSGGSVQPVRPPVIVPSPGPLMRGAGGAAAPAAAKNPYLGAGNSK